MTKGAIIFPNISPNFIHMFKGDNIFEFNNPKIRKIMEIKTK